VLQSPPRAARVVDMHRKVVCLGEPGLGRAQPAVEVVDQAELTQCLAADPVAPGGAGSG
jgi:hypothetical protein